MPSGLARSMARPRLTCAGRDEHRLAVLVVPEAVVHLGHDAERLDEGEADDVGEAHLAAAAAGEVVVDDDAVVDEQLRGHRAHRRGGRDLERGLHVRHDAGAGPPDRGLARRRRAGRTPAGPRARAASGWRRRRAPDGPAVPPWLSGGAVEPAAASWSAPWRPGRPGQVAAPARQPVPERGPGPGPAAGAGAARAGRRLGARVRGRRWSRRAPARRRPARLRGGRRVAAQGALTGL